MRTGVVSAGSRDAAPARYTLVAIVLHWLIALGIATQLVLGLSMTKLALTQTTMFRYYQLHKSIGITVLLLVLLRILWRLSHRPPPLPAGIPALERRAAGGVHWGLYALILLVPLAGWAMVSASPYNIPTVLYGHIPWPDLPVLPTLADKKAAEAAFKSLHNVLALLLIPIVAVHGAAALRHHFVRRDPVLWRMLPFVARRS